MSLKNLINDKIGMEKELGKDVLTSYDSPLVHPLLLCLNDPNVKRAHLPSNKRKKANFIVNH